MIAERSLRVPMFRLGYPLGDVASRASIHHAQGSEQDVKRFILWKVATDIQSDGGPLIRTRVLHNESEHIRKVRLNVKPRTCITEVSPLVLPPPGPLVFKLRERDRD